MSPIRILSLAPLLALVSPRPALACDTAPCDYVLCLQERTLCLIDEGDAGRAAELLLEEEEKFEQYRDYHLLLAAAYLADDDTAGVLQVLDAHIENNPDDCEARSWLAWVYMEHGFKELTSEILQAGGCATEAGPLALRFGLLSAYLHVKKGEEGDGGFRELEVDEIYDKDLDLYRYLRAALSPHYQPPFFISFSLQAGYTSNAMFGSASDPAMAHKKMDSPLLGHELRLGYAPLVAHLFSPSVELTSNSSIFLFEDESRSRLSERAASADPLDFSSFDFGVRAGFKFLRPHDVYPWIFAGYRGDVLFLNMEDRYTFRPPVVFYEGHRAEIELAPAGDGFRFHPAEWVSAI